MTPDQLEREIAKALNAGWVDESDKFDIEKAATATSNLIRQKMREVAEKAWEASWLHCYNAEFGPVPNPHPSKQEWLKENNLLNDEQGQEK